MTSEVNEVALVGASPSYTTNNGIDRNVLNAGPI